MKILWFSNIELSESAIRGTGSWLGAMSAGLMTTGNVDLVNISCGNVSKITRRDYGLIKQWIVPQSYWFSYQGLPPKAIIDAIIKVVDDFAPDLVHVWGVENYWGLLVSRKLIKQKALLEIQGLKGAIEKVYTGNLSFCEQLKCVGIKEVVKRTSIFKQKKMFKKWGESEREIILGHDFISTQSDWTLAQVSAINPFSRYFRATRALRDSFCNGTEWQFTGEPVIFSTAAYPAPFKGLHVAVRALNILKLRFPNIQLRIAGGHQTHGIRKDGYTSWLCKEIRRMGLEDNVRWLGALSGPQIVSELLECSVVVLPSFIESYCLAFAEAMMLGVPVTGSYTGGTSFLAKDEVSALFFPPGDEAACAYQLGRLLINKSLATRLSKVSRLVALKRNSLDHAVSRQLQIYSDVISCHL